MGKILVWHCPGCDEIFRTEEGFGVHNHTCRGEVLKRTIIDMLNKDLIIGNMPPGKDTERWKRVKRKVQRSAFDIEDITWNESESLDDVNEVTLLVKEWVYITYRRKPRP